ncbi:CoA transferase [Kitasatospora sp. LaBMicrA B282]|uniref:CoA transferase n=1 Tax=Kitasatospora sp. LaBMicrA B282 TaxID=3420949 RepID=UPI003D0F393D
MPRISTNRPLLRQPGSAVGATGPLAGVRLVATGEGPAVRLAVRQLWSLGCQLGPPGTPDCDQVGQLALGSIGCTIDWAGPVALPLRSEAEVQAACGIAEVHGRRYGGPQPLGIDYAGAVAGVLAVQGLLAARFAALHGSPVRTVRTSVAQAALLTVGRHLAAATADTPAGPTGPTTSPEPTDPPEPTEATEPTAAAPPFTSRDGVRFEIEARTADQWLAFWSGLDVPGPVIDRGWPAFRLRSATARCPLPAELATATAAVPYQELTITAAAAGVSIVPLRAAGPRGYPAPPWRIAQAGTRQSAYQVPFIPGQVGPGQVGPGQVVPGQAGPARGATSTTRTPGRPPTPALPLTGVRVVELTERVRGQLAGHLLGLLGAEVFRLEPLGGDRARAVPPLVGGVSARFRTVNRGKQAVEADPRSTAGHRRIRELVGTADVFLHDLPPGRAAELGLGAGPLLADRPGLVHAWASGWGELFGLAAPFGSDGLVQAHSGLAALVTPPGLPPTPSLLTVAEVFCGLISAEAVLAGLLARAVTGFGQRVESSLWSAAVTLLDFASPALPTPPTPLGRGAGGHNSGSSSGAPGRQGGGRAVNHGRAATVGEVADDPRFAPALERDGCVLPRAPWEFG